MIWLFCLFTSLTHAQQSYEEFLAHPIEQRMQEFQEYKADGAYRYLPLAAFNRQLNMQTRWRALTTMGRLDPLYFRADLERALQAKEWFLRNAGLIAIQTADRNWAVKWSTRLLDDPALVVRTQAVRNLIQLDAREADGALWKQVFDRRNYRGQVSLWVREHIAEALVRFASSGQTGGFQRLLMDADERLHKWAVLGLEKTTGFKLGDKNVPVEIRRQQWLDRLGVEAI